MICFISLQRLYNRFFNREVLALGGLIKNTTKESLSKTPILGDIPILGWLFKNKSKSIDKTSLLVLMSTKIIPAHATSEVNLFTQDRLEKYRGATGDFAVRDQHDPIHRLFFAESADRTKDLGEFLFERHQRTRRKERIHKRAQEKKQVRQQRRGRKRKEAPETTPNKITATTPPKKTAAPSSSANPSTLSELRRTGAPADRQPTTIAAPESKNNEQTTALNGKKRRSRSLSSFLSPSAREKLV